MAEFFDNDAKQHPMNINDFMTQLSGRDPKTGRFLKGHSGNRNGRPKAPTTLNECFKKVGSEFVEVEKDGKKIKIHKMQLLVEKIVDTVLMSDNVNDMLKVCGLFKTLDLTSYLPPSKIKHTNYEDDPSVTKIKNAIYNKLDEYRDAHPRTKYDYIDPPKVDDGE